MNEQPGRSEDLETLSQEETKALEMHGIRLEALREILAGKEDPDINELGEAFEYTLYDAFSRIITTMGPNAETELVRIMHFCLRNSISMGHFLRVFYSSILYAVERGEIEYVAKLTSIVKENGIPLEASLNNVYKENERLVRKNTQLTREKDGLRHQLDVTKQQEVAMAALYRGATPTIEARRECARVLSPEMFEKDV